MDLFYIRALASFSGSASGTLASIVTGWVTHDGRTASSIHSGPPPRLKRLKRQVT